MRSAIALVFVFLTSAATAQTATNAVCIKDAPTAAAAPAMPSIAAGTVAARNRDYALALANFKPLAEKGDADAERAMGQLLMLDCTGLQNPGMAVDWLNKAAAGGNVSAQNQLGFAYLRGRGVTQDDARAFVYFNQTAATGNAQGESQLAYLYFTGRGVALDKYQSLQWAVKAAEQGNAAGLSDIAEAYIHGAVLERDPDRAAYFLVLTNQRATVAERAGLMGLSQEIRQAVSASELARAADHANRRTPGAGSLRDVLSDAEDFRKEQAKKK